LVISEQKLAFIVGAPKLIGSLPQRQRCALCTTTHAAAPLDQAVAIEHCMNGAFGRNRNSGKPADEALADFPRTPGSKIY